MMKDHVSGHGTTLSVSGSPDHRFLSLIMLNESSFAITTCGGGTE